MFIKNQIKNDILNKEILVLEIFHFNFLFVLEKKIGKLYINLQLEDSLAVYVITVSLASYAIIPR